MQFNFRNIQELIIDWGKKDPQLYEALKRVNNFCVDLNKFLNDPTFAKVNVGELVFTADRNQLTQASSMTHLFRIIRKTNQTIPDNTATRVSFDTVDYDTDDLIDITGSPDFFTVKTTGYYILGTTVMFDKLTIVPFFDHWVSIRVNGTQKAHDYNFTNETVALNTSTLIYLKQNDLVDVLMYQSSGSSISSLANLEYSPVFWAHRLS